MQPIRRPVGRLVGTMTPNGSYLLSAHALPDALTPQNLVLGHELHATFGDDSLRNRRCLTVDFSAKDAE